MEEERCPGSVATTGMACRCEATIDGPRAAPGWVGWRWPSRSLPSSVPWALARACDTVNDHAPNRTSFENRPVAWASALHRPGRERRRTLQGRICGPGAGATWLGQRGDPAFGRLRGPPAGLLGDLHRPLRGDCSWTAAGRAGATRPPRDACTADPLTGDSSRGAPAFPGSPANHWRTLERWEQRASRRRTCLPRRHLSWCRRLRGS
jgi:hypothetical protein